MVFCEATKAHENTPPCVTWHPWVPLLRFQLEDGDSQSVTGKTFLWPEGGAEGATSKGTSALKRFFQCGFETTVPAPCFPSLVSLMVCLHAQHTGRLCSAFSPAPLPGIPAVGGRVGGGLPVGLRASASSPPQLGETDIKDCILSAPAPSLSFPGGAAAPALSCCCIKWVQVTTVHPGLCSSTRV